MATCDASFFCTVYPRWRGELMRVTVLCLRRRGLSPLARGTLSAPHKLGSRSRFIPAGAGNSPAYATMKIQKPVYPRWRGELSSSARIMPAAGGLSPLARGTHRRAARMAGPHRFIPAGAGNSGPPCSHLPNFPVYPRWRGELNMSFVNFGAINGLSPLARGTLYKRGEFMETVRFIPAGAGNSLVF